MVELRIVQLPASEMDNFSYLIYCPQTLRGAVVDPSQYPERLLDKAAELEVSIELLLNTHGHQDHVAGNSLIRERTRAQLAAHPSAVANPDIALDEGDHLDLGEGRIEVLYTPGHAPGSLVFRIGDSLITGDTLFVSRCGRADLPGSDVAALYASLKRLATFPDSTKIYPGHDYGPIPTSTMGWERQHNAFLQCPDLESFIELRMG